MNGRGPNTAHRVIAALALVLAVAWTTPAVAEVELAAGAALGNDNGMTWAGWASWLGQPREHARWHWRPEITGAAVGGRTTRGTRYGSVPVAGAGLRVGIGDFFAGGSLALALGDHRTPELSTRHQFITTVGWRRERFAIAYRHISNGSTGRPNGGEDLLAVAIYLQ